MPQWLNSVVARIVRPGEFHASDAAARDALFHALDRHRSLGRAIRETVMESVPVWNVHDLDGELYATYWLSEVASGAGDLVSRVLVG
jgi:hypothetical protein